MTTRTNDVQVVDLATGQTRWSAKAADEIVLSTAFSPDLSLLATGPGYADSIIRLWNVDTGEELAQLEGHEALVLALLLLGR